MYVFWNYLILIILQFLTIFEDNYPEIVKHIIVIKGSYLQCVMLYMYTCGQLSHDLINSVHISAPKVFPVAFKLIKPFLDEATRQKMKVLGGKYTLITHTYAHVLS